MERLTFRWIHLVFSGLLWNFFQRTINISEPD